MYETRDMHVAAFLLAQGHSIHSIVKRDHVAVFAFNPPVTEEMARGFFSGAQIGARLFAYALKDIRTLAYETVNRKEGQ